ncbi:MAG TPA: glycosyltransferase [Pyrinomonadaceae bacterium]|nr:glycosyltransferase [Pyrinomonadaceae bacterium]
MTRTLYICYFGLRQPLVQTQVLPYLREIGKDDVGITLLTFEPNLHKDWSKEELEAKQIELAATGIDWHALPYHKRPSLPATAYDVLNGVLYVRRLLKKTRFDVLHARVHIPALIAVLVRKFSRHNPKILFDIRGFVPEEYADAGVWKKGGFLFRVAKRAERWIMRQSDGFVVLTEAARETLFPESRADGYDKLKRPIEVIPCCVDFKKRFSVDIDDLRSRTRAELNLDGRQVIIHVGSLSGLYLTPQIIEFLKVAKERDPGVFAVFLTHSDHAEIVERLLTAGFTEKDFLVKKVDQQDVPAYLAASDIGLSFVQSSYATISRSPTKIPEYLASGLPVIANSGVGDVDELIVSNRVGAVAAELDAASYHRALEEVAKLDGVHERAIATSNREFDLESVGGERYRRLYRRLVERQKKTLYISYFGIREPLVQTQVLPYLREVNRGRYPDRVAEGATENTMSVSILTFEPVALPDAAAIKAELAANGINWYSLPYHKRFSAIATTWDILRGTFFVRRFIARERPDVLHGRVHVPTLMGALGRKLSRHKPRLLFDIRGFFPEEYTDAGVWPENGLMYRAAKRVEQWLLHESDGFVVLTDRARKLLFPETEAGLASGNNNGAGSRQKAMIRRTGRGHHDRLGRPVEVIPCCVDFDRFAAANGRARGEIRSELGVTDRRVIGYVGSFGGWYLTNEMLDFFAAAKEYDPRTLVMILTSRNHDQVAEKLRARGFKDSDFIVKSVSPAEVPRYLRATDLAVSFIKACYSKQSSSPTKIAEYLACGIPVIANRGVGDIDELIGGNGIGVLVNDFSDESYRNALQSIDRLGKVGETCRTFAMKEFDLEMIGGNKYRRIYARLLGAK